MAAKLGSKPTKPAKIHKNDAMKRLSELNYPVETKLLMF